MRRLLTQRAGEVSMRYVREVMKREKLKREAQEIQVHHQPSGLSVWISKYSLLKQRVGGRG